MSWIKLSQTLDRYKQNKQLTAAMLCGIAQQVVGDQARVVSIKDGTLLLDAGSSGAAANLQMQSNEMIKILNAKLGSPLVKKIRFVAGIR
ncbi:DUF721 domain-containing protein [Candidatus Berkelbacteria bacterium]|nr:DUF721 domain-containing protein [Candidatus Berkelbacteria bacterium]